MVRHFCSGVVNEGCCKPCAWQAHVILSEIQCLDIGVELSMRWGGGGRAVTVGSCEGCTSQIFLLRPTTPL